VYANFSILEKASKVALSSIVDHASSISMDVYVVKNIEVNGTRYSYVYQLHS